MRRGAFIFSLVPFVFSLLLLAAFEPRNTAMQFTEQAAWIPRFGISYSLGVDGMSLFLVLLTTFLVPLVILSGWGDVHKRVKEYMIFLMSWRPACSAPSSRSTCSCSTSSGK